MAHQPQPHHQHQPRSSASSFARELLDYPLAHTEIPFWRRGGYDGGAPSLPPIHLSRDSYQQGSQSSSSFLALPPAALINRTVKLGGAIKGPGTLTSLLARVGDAQKAYAVLGEQAPTFLYAPAWATVRLRGIAGDAQTHTNFGVRHKEEEEEYDDDDAETTSEMLAQPPLKPKKILGDAANVFADAVLATLEDKSPRPATPDPTPADALGDAREAVKPPPPPKGPPKSKGNKAAASAAAKMKKAVANKKGKGKASAAAQPANKSKTGNGGKSALKAAAHAATAAQRMQKGFTKLKPPDDGHFTCQTSVPLSLPSKYNFDWRGEAKEARSCIDILSAYATGSKALAARVALGVVTKEEAREAKKKAAAKK
ncbi:hypothetical protein RI054_40g146790 [Pseudoscourfieldia marina]